MGLAAAVGVASVAFSATAVLETVAVVGAVVSVVGAVTKNPILSDIGMGLGLVGGVGALATSALGLSSTSLFGATAAAGTDAAATGATAVGEAANTAFDGAGIAADAVPDTFGSLAGTAVADPAGIAPASVFNQPLSAAEDVPVLYNSTSPAVPTADAPAITGASDPAAPAPTGTINSTPSATAATPSTAAPTPSTALQASAGTANNLGTIGTTSGPGTGGNLTSTTRGPAAQPGMLDNLLSYVDKHPTVGFGALQGVSSLIGGWTSTLTPAQVANYNAQAAANQAQANLVTQQTQNLAMPKAVASSAPVTGSPQPLVPQQMTGLINSAPSVSPLAITGKVAAA